MGNKAWKPLAILPRHKLSCEIRRSFAFAVATSARRSRRGNHSRGYRRNQFSFSPKKLHFICMRETTKWVLKDSEIPDSWLNIAMLVRDEYPLPLRGPERQPMTVTQLAELYSEECARIDMLDGSYGKELHVSVPGEVMDEYCKYRCTPLIRARGLERARKRRRRASQRRRQHQG